VNWLRPHAAQLTLPVIDGPVDSTSTTDVRGDSGLCEATAADERYRLLSIDAVDAPEDCLGDDWHRYRIAQGKNGITGFRCGDLARVRLEVAAIVTALNERRDWGKVKAPAKNQRRAAAQRARGDIPADET
jgi:hypothetical protein